MQTACPLFQIQLKQQAQKVWEFKDVYKLSIGTVSDRVMQCAMEHWCEMEKTKFQFRILFFLFFFFFRLIAMLNPSQFTSPAFAYWLKSLRRSVLPLKSTQHDDPKPALTSKPQRRRRTWAGWDLTGGSRLPQSPVASRLHTEETHADKCRLDSGLGLIQSQDDCPRQRWTVLDCFTLKRPEKTKARLVRVNLAIAADVVGHWACWPDRITWPNSTVYNRVDKNVFSHMSFFLHRLQTTNSVFNETFVGKTKKHLYINTLFFSLSVSGTFLFTLCWKTNLSVKSCFRQTQTNVLYAI